MHGVTLTASAAKHVAAHPRQARQGRRPAAGRAHVGLLGLAYKLEYADEVRPEDSRFESHGVTVIVDPKSLPYLDGTELDFAREG